VSAARHYRGLRRAEGRAELGDGQLRWVGRIFRSARREGPEVILLFWVVKILTTAAGSHVGLPQDLRQHPGARRILVIVLGLALQFGTVAIAPSRTGSWPTPSRSRDWCGRFPASGRPYPYAGTTLLWR